MPNRARELPLQPDPPTEKRQCAGRNKRLARARQHGARPRRPPTKRRAGSCDRVFFCAHVDWAAGRAQKAAHGYAVRHTRRSSAPGAPPPGRGREGGAHGVKGRPLHDTDAQPVEGGGRGRRKCSGHVMQQPLLLRLSTGGRTPRVGMCAAPADGSKRRVIASARQGGSAVQREKDSGTHPSPEPMRAVRSPTAAARPGGAGCRCAQAQARSFEVSNTGVVAHEREQGVQAVRRPTCIAARACRRLGADRGRVSITQRL